MSVRQLRSTESDLTEIFERNITLRQIASILESLDADVTVAGARAHMHRKGYDDIGVARGPVRLGYASVSELTDGTLGQWIRPFPNEATLPADMPLTRALRSIHESTRVFVGSGNDVWGIATRADLEKLPVRLHLYGLITLIEMQLLRLVRSVPESEWRLALTEGRIEIALDTYGKRFSREVETDLAECLEFCDKYDALVDQPWFLTGIGLSKTRAVRTFRRLQNVRDDLAHAEPISLDAAVFVAPDLLAKLEEIRG